MKLREATMYDAYHPHGVALLDCYRGNRTAILTCIRTASVTMSRWLFG